MRWAPLGALGGALSDFGINDNFMKELAASIKPGNAALFVLIKNMTADKVLKEIKDAGGVVLKTSLDETKEQSRRPRQSNSSRSAAAIGKVGLSPYSDPLRSRKPNRPPFARRRSLPSPERRHHRKRGAFSDPVNMPVTVH